MKKKLKPIAIFKREQDEREFWNTRDTTDYFDFFGVQPGRNRVRSRDRSSGEVHLPQASPGNAQRTKGARQQKGYSVSIPDQSLLGAKNRGRTQGRLVS